MDKQKPHGPRGRGSQQPQRQLKEALRKLRAIEKRLEKKSELLAVSNTLLDRVFASPHSMIAYMDPDFNFLRVNRAYGVADGRDPDWFVGKNHFDLYPNSENQAIFRKVVETGTPYFASGKPFEYDEHPERGTTFWDWSLYPLQSKDGQVSGLVLNIVNVTERVRAEQALRKSTAELERRVTDRTAELQSANAGLAAANEELTVEIEQREQVEKQIRVQLTALESAANGIVITDRSGSIVWVNPAFAQLTGYTPEEVIGQNPRVLKSGQHDRSFYGQLWGRILAGDVWFGEVVNRRKDGSLYVEEMSITPVRQADGEITHFIAIKQDVTRRIKAEQAIRESEERFRRIFEEGPLGMATVGLDFRLSRANARFCGMLGYTEKELVGRTFAEITYKEDIGKDLPLAGRLLRGEIPFFRLEKRYVTKDGAPVWAELTASTIRDQEGRPLYFLGMIEDITERKRSEGAIQKLNQELADRADALAAANKELEAFSYSVSHDLRAPLKAIDGFTAILEREYAAHLDEGGRHLIELVRGNAQEMDKLVDGLLAFSRLSRQPLSKQAVDMTALVQQALEMLAPERENRSISLSIGNLPACEGDPVLLKQVWVNLIGNALKYTRKREETRIEIGSRKLRIPSPTPSSEPTTLNSELQEPETVYYVCDNGVGFDMERADRLFGVFQRLHRAEDYPGTGVGLAIVQRIIHRHNGRVWAEADVDKGATFYFTLP